MSTLKITTVALAMLGAATASALACTAAATTAPLAADPGHSWTDHLPHSDPAHVDVGAAAT